MTDQLKQELSNFDNLIAQLESPFAPYDPDLMTREEYDESSKKERARLSDLASQAAIDLSALYGQYAEQLHPKSS